MASDRDAVRQAARAALDDQLVAMTQQRDALNDDIARYEAAIAALDGHVPARRRSSPTARASLVAALATFTAPVHTTALLDHGDLVHYSRHTLRSALADLNQAGLVKGTRGPKGFIWDPESARQDTPTTRRKK